METERLDESATENPTIENVVAGSDPSEGTPKDQSSLSLLEGVKTSEPSFSRPNSVFQNMIDSIRQWLDLQKQIRAYPKQARQRLKDIEAAFLAYRVTYASLTFKAPKIEE